jgi:hypothetical protein
MSAPGRTETIAVVGDNGGPAMIHMMTVVDIVEADWGLGKDGIVFGMLGL